MPGSPKPAVGILGATGTVGQRFVSLLEHHPWFEIQAVAASARSAGKSYHEAVAGRWTLPSAIPERVAALRVLSIEDDLETMKDQVDFVFSAIEADKDAIRRIEESYAAAGIPVISNNSAHRWTDDVPVILPEINPHHLDMIPIQQRRRGWQQGFIVVKPNCSIQSYVPALEALRAFEPARVIVTTLQAISGAGKTFETWPEMVDNVIPLIGGEEEKSEREPLKIWGRIEGEAFVLAPAPEISASCIRVPVTDGHMAVVNVALKHEVSEDEIIRAFKEFKDPIASLHLPSSPDSFLSYFGEDDRPQTRLDRDLGNGMGVSLGRLRPDPILGWKFVSLSHNTVRGAAGGAILVAELLKAKQYL